MNNPKKTQKQHEVNDKSNLKEHRKSLNRLEEEIEKEMKEIENLTKVAKNKMPFSSITTTTNSGTTSTSTISTSTITYTASTGIDKIEKNQDLFADMVEHNSNNIMENYYITNGFKNQSINGDFSGKFNTLGLDQESQVKSHNWSDNEQSMQDILLNLQILKPNDNNVIALGPTNDNNNNNAKACKVKSETKPNTVSYIAKAMNLQKSPALNNYLNRDARDDSTTKVAVSKKPVQWSKRSHEISKERSPNQKNPDKLLAKIEENFNTKYAKQKDKLSIMNENNNIEQQEKITRKSKNLTSKYSMGNKKASPINENNTSSKKTTLGNSKKKNGKNVIETKTFVIDEAENNNNGISKTEPDNASECKIDPFFNLYQQDYENINKKNTSNAEIKGSQQTQPELSDLEGKQNSKIERIPLRNITQNHKQNTSIYEGSCFAAQRGNDCELSSRTINDGITTERSQSHIRDKSNDYNQMKRDISSKSFSKMKDTSSGEMSYRFRPQLSKKSLDIASKMGDAFQRLVEGNKAQAQEKRRSLIKDIDSDLTFKPAINKNSIKLDSTFKEKEFNGDQLHRWDQLLILHNKTNIEKKLKKLEQEKKELENEAQYNFTPSLNKATNEINRAHNTDIIERFNTWQKRKEDRINHERNLYTERELENCTFKPSISIDNLGNDTKMKHSISSNNLKDLQSVVKGVESHFERVELAKRKQQEKEALINKNNGSKWQYKLTIPQEVRLYTEGTSPRMTPSPMTKMKKNIVFYGGNRTKSTHSLFENTKDEILSTSVGYGRAISHLHNELHKLEF